MVWRACLVARLALPMNPPPPANLTGARWFCPVTLSFLFCSLALGALSVFEELTQRRAVSCMSATDSVTALWLVFAFPLGLIAIALHYAVPGPGRGKGWLTQWLTAIFLLSVPAALGLRLWWYDEWIGDRSAAIDCIWWLAWLWA